MKEQLDLFSPRVEITKPRPVPHQRHSATSRAAAKDVEPKFGGTRWKVYAWLKENGGATDEAIQERAGILANSERPARVTLVEDGFVRDSGRTATVRSGKQAVVWESASMNQKPGTKEILEFIDALSEQNERGGSICYSRHDVAAMLEGIKVALGDTALLDWMQEGLRKSVAVYGPDGEPSGIGNAWVIAGARASLRENVALAIAAGYKNIEQTPTDTHTRRTT